MLKKGSLFSVAELEKLEQLIGMGFERDRSLIALASCGWDVEAALVQLTEGVLGADGLSAEQPGDLVGAGLCVFGCGRCRLDRWPSCCRQCRGSGGPHTRSCRQRLQEKNLSARSRAAAASPASAPLNPSAPPEPTGGDACPVCLEQVELIVVGSDCHHGVCRACSAAMLASGLHLCPLCRAPARGASSSAASATEPDSAGPSTPMYVVLAAPQGGSGNTLGLHACSWPELERRLRVPRGQLAGNLGTWGVAVRRVPNRAAGLVLWRLQHTGPMPERD